MNFKERYNIAKMSNLTFIGKLVVSLIIFLPFEISLIVNHDILLSLVLELIIFIFLFCIFFILIICISTFSWLIFNDGDYILDNYIITFVYDIIIFYKILFGNYPNKWSFKK